MKITIFLASSNELKEERDAFELEIFKKNRLLENRNIQLEPHLWEDFSAKMSSTRSQDEYNRVLKDDDIFVLLVYSRLGKYSEEEFEAAHHCFKTAGKPIVLVYLKESDIKKADVDTSLDTFKQRLKDLEHFPASYTDFNSLWNQFNKELDSYIEKMLTCSESEEKTPQPTTIYITETHSGIGDNVGGDKIIRG